MTRYVSDDLGRYAAALVVWPGCGVVPDPGDRVCGPVGMVAAAGDGGGGVCVLDGQGRRYPGQAEGGGDQEGDPVSGQVGYLVPGDEVGRSDQHDGRGEQGDADGSADLTRGVEH